MDQVSRPMLIALAAVLVLAGVWLVALRPKPVSVDSTPLAPTKAIPAAKQAGVTSDAANAKLKAAGEAADSGAPAAPTAPARSAANSVAPTAPAAAKTPGQAAKTSPASQTKQEHTVLREISNGKVVVMLFWSADSADDVATRGAVAR